MEQERIKLSEAAARFHVSRGALKHRIRTGQLPAKRFGNRVIYVKPGDVERLFVDVPPPPSAVELFAKLDEIDARLGLTKRPRKGPAETLH